MDLLQMTMTCNSETVDIPETLCPLRDSDMEQLYTTIPPLQHSANYGIDLYEHTLSFISSLLNN